MTPRFHDRISAGRELARALAAFGGPDTVVLGLPRGGLPVAAEVARALNAGLEVVLVRKIGMPFDSELALGAIAGPEGQSIVLNPGLVRALGIDDAGIEALARPARAELARRRALWGTRLQPGALAGKRVILVDDGIATGATMRAAIAAVRAERPAQIVVATPVAAPSALAELHGLADDLICLHAPQGFVAVGTHYARFPQVEDDEVRALLDSPQHPGQA
jgi:putative phosphoribosyl transferase